jgi:CDP-diacylglycerol--glycerol-3-phosphate 3-phosphatidyltransferase
LISGRFSTAANWISIARIPLAGFSALMLYNGQKKAAAAAMALAIASDALDGAVARRTGSVSDWGKVLDPLADKAAFIIMAITLLCMGLIEQWLLWLLVCRDSLIALGGIVMSKRMRPPAANKWGKVSTSVLALYIVRQALFSEHQFPRAGFFLGTDALGLISALLIVVSFATYVVIFAKSNGRLNAS